MYIQSGEWDTILNIKTKWKKANTLHAQMIFAMFFVCIIPLIIMSIALVKGPLAFCLRDKLAFVVQQF